MSNTSAANSYYLVISFCRRRQLDAFLAANPNPEYVVWLTGSGEWQVRVYPSNAEEAA